MQLQITNELAQKYHQALPERIRAYLNQRCIPDEIIDKFKLGLNGSAITIPIYDKQGDFLFFKYRKDPEDKSDKAKYWYDPETSAELYGWENVEEHFVILCEGELDRLVLESKGIPAITSTGGAVTFKEEWVTNLKEIPNLYICYDRDDAGFTNAKKILEKLPHSRYISLSSLPKDKKDITDFFAAGNQKEDFIKLVKEAKALDELNFYYECLGSPEIRFLHPSQDFIKDTAYFTIPAIEYRKEDKNPLKHIYYVVSNGQPALLKLENIHDFYDKYRLLINKLPAIKNPDTRWPKELIGKYVFENYKPDPLQIHKTIKDVYMKYAEIKDFQWYYILPLWVIGTYFYTIFETYPYLAFEGVKGSGKTKVARITTRMSFNGIPSINLTDASLFRIIESLRCTVWIDEGESLKDHDKAQALRAVLNGGYSKGTSIIRQEKTAKDNFIAQNYEIYSPKLISNTRGLEDTLQSRTIRIIMLRAKSERGMILDTETSEQWDIIRHDCYCFALNYFTEIRGIYLNDPTVKIANNRHNDLWCPLLSIGKFIFKDDEAEFNALKEFANKQIDLSQEDSLDDYVDALLKSISALSDQDGRYYESKDIKEQMKTYLDEEQIERITPEWIGYRLKDFGFKKHRQNKGTRYFLKESDVKDILERYVGNPISPENPTHPTHLTHPTSSSEGLV